MKTGGTTQAIFPPASAVMQAIAVSVGGFRGLIVLSLLSAAVVLVASCGLAPASYRLAIVVAVGLGGPLWFYAVSGWEHAPAVALGTAAFAVGAEVADGVEAPPLGRRCAHRRRRDDAR